jgi:hypothetical protein
LTRAGPHPKPRRSITATHLTPACAALLYAPDGYDTSHSLLMGRHAVGGFLDGLVGLRASTGWSR